VTPMAGEFVVVVVVVHCRRVQFSFPVLISCTTTRGTTAAQYSSGTKEKSTPPKDDVCMGIFDAPAPIVLPFYR